MSTQRGPGRPPGAGGQQGKTALLKSTRELIAERGISGVTLREVAERAGVRPALVNYYFGSKAELLRAVIEETAERAVTEIAAAAERGDNAPERLANLVKRTIAAFADDPQLPRLVMEMVFLADDAFTDRFVAEYSLPNVGTIVRVLSEGQQSGELRPVDIRFFMPQMMGMAIMFFLAQPVLRRAFGMDEITPELREQFADSVAEQLLYGLVPRGATT